ncbi:hypothetical protein EYC84_002249 [Monilinia fructicola]|uniref:EGF-like domain-containing protein n=1 Tax=Monilinia fructicola TaxID=38448 RepID=A0A5M9JPH4_MONFR|nr:hypothetical protein EYC84_002249 [Monilinia fructicola]
MSQQQWDSTTRGGSVKRARERAAAGRPTEPVPAPRPYDPTSPSNIPSPPRARFQGSSGTSKSGAQSAVGMAISRPTQVAQWPLIGTTPGSEPQQYQPPPNRGPPPQRPPRPSHVPSLLDSSRIQDITPTFQYQPQPRQPPQPQNSFPLPQARISPRNQADDFDQSFPSMQSPLTSSSRPSTVSSVGTIPDFPVPVPAIPPSVRRSANLGPPPTSRRGASSYYSQASYVSPIPEVSEGMGLSPRTLPGSHSSYASSAAIPSSWGPESPGYYRSDEDDYDYDYENDRRFDAVSEGRESRGSDDNDDRGLIRSASIGKRARPSMITTRSSGQIDPAQIDDTPVQPDTHRLGPTPLQQSSLSPVDAQRSTQWPITGNPNSPLASGTGLIDPTPSSSDESVPTIATAMTTDLPPRNGTRSPGANAMLGAYQAASALPSDTIRTKSPFANEGGPFSRLSAIRRPPRLNIDAVRDAEARGSLTSLPDLIRRATRLASMMDRGKRPGSRMGLDDFPMERDFPNEKEIELSPNFVRQDSTLSGMLSAFPPPGRETPARDTPRPASAWPEYDPNDPKSSTAEKKQRKCCGLPCWGFIVVFIILLIIIAAAVVVPLKFLVIDKPPTSTAATTTPEQKCAADPSTTCKNGGTSYIDNAVCSCICTNGFTGSTCTVAGSTGCTTMSSGTATNITIGDSIPRLISAAQTNFSVPLFENTILARFNSGNLSCASENSLVTFDGNDERIGDANAEATPTKASKIKKDAQPDSTKVMVRAIAGAGSDSTYTSTNIIAVDSSTPEPTYASSQYEATSYISAASTSAALPYATSSPTTTKTSSAIMTTSTIDPTAVFTITEEVLDFARVTVLFVLQQENLDNAVTAQGQLQKFFNQQSFENLAAMNVSMGGGNSVNLVEFKLDLGNGTVGQKNTVT